MYVFFNLIKTQKMDKKFFYFCYFVAGLISISYTGTALVQHHLVSGWVSFIEFFLLGTTGYLFLFVKNREVSTGRLSDISWLLLWLSTLATFVGFVLSLLSQKTFFGISFSSEFVFYGALAATITLPLIFILVPWCLILDIWNENYQSLKEVEKKEVNNVVE
jgi:lipoprotein signal peptidase